MPALARFVFLHALQPAQLAPFHAALPDVEFVVADAATLPPGLRDAQAAAIGWDFSAVDALLDAAPALRWLQFRGAGVERLVTPRLAASEVVLTNGSGNHAPNMAEHLLGMMLAFARGFPQLLRAQQERRWARLAMDEVFELSGQTLAIVGLGAIGQELAWRAAALGMRVVGVRRSADAALPRGVERVESIASLDAVLPLADHVAVTLPLTAETQGLFDAARLARCKPGAHLYNVGRGPVVDAAALLHALDAGQLGGAGLDVVEPEPLPAESPLWAHPRVMITAHTAGLTPRSFERYQALLLDNLQRFARGEPLRNVVDPRRGY
jgi:phosphoglycerate dehydrogenase-like enzyme